MRKKFFAVMFVAVAAAFAGYNVCQSQNATLSDLALDNVEALARGEIEDYQDFHLVSEGSCKVCRRSGGVCNVHDQVPC